MRRRASASRFSSATRAAPHHHRDTRADATIARRSQMKAEFSLKNVKQKIEKSNSFREQLDSYSTPSPRWPPYVRRDFSPDAP
jgi:hypothetical protein